MAVSGQPGITATPQPVLSPLTAAAIFLVVSVNPGGESAARDLLGDMAALQRSVGFRVPAAELVCPFERNPRA